jgi:HD-GYP domain-containing protein (c-di-GMP phosphodiesterase class II)
MPSSIATNQPNADLLAGFVPVQVRTLRSTKADAVDLYLRYEFESEPRLYTRAGTRPDESQFEELHAAGVEHLYVRDADFPTLSSDLMGSLEQLLKSPAVGPADKFAALQLSVAVAVDQTLRLVDCAKFCTLADDISSNIVALVGSSHLLPCELFWLARHDFNTFTHVTNVAAYSVLLARESGITDESDLRKIASGALLHDIGKRFIPKRILAKADRLTDEQRELLESHPARGYTELCELGRFDYGQLMMVYQHHEHVDGTGYPVRVLKNEIHPWARILSVVDVFDTMTAKRPNRTSAMPDSVLRYLREQAGTRFDGEYVECWNSAMTKA